MENLNWGIQPGGRYSVVDVPWRDAVPAYLDYLPMSPENMRANAVASVTISFKSTVWHASKVSPITATSSVIGCQSGGLRLG